MTLPYASVSVVVRSDWAREQEGVLGRYLAAHLDALDLLQRDREKSVRTLAKWLSISRGDAERAYSEFVKAWSVDGTVGRDAVEPIITALQQQNSQSEPPKMEDLLDMTYLENARKLRR